MMASFAGAQKKSLSPSGRKVVLAVPGGGTFKLRRGLQGLDLVSDLIHYIYRYFQLQPIKPLAASVEGGVAQ